MKSARLISLVCTMGSVELVTLFTFLTQLTLNLPKLVVSVLDLLPFFISSDLRKWEITTFH